MDQRSRNGELALEGALKLGKNLRADEQFVFGQHFTQHIGA
jgi:hypothetical protein